MYFCCFGVPHCVKNGRGGTYFSLTLTLLCFHPTDPSVTHFPSSSPALSRVYSLRANHPLGLPASWLFNFLRHIIYRRGLCPYVNCLLNHNCTCYSECQCHISDTRYLLFCPSSMFTQFPVMLLTKRRGSH